MDTETRRSPRLPNQRRGASQLVTQVVVILLMLGTFAGVFGVLYYANKQPAGPKTRQVLLFTVSHDRTCREMDPFVQRLASSGLNFQRIDIETEPGLKAKHGVVLVPCAIVLEEGREISRHTGAMTEEFLRGKLQGQ